MRKEASDYKLYIIMSITYSFSFGSCVRSYLYFLDALLLFQSFLSPKFSVLFYKIHNVKQILFSSGFYSVPCICVHLKS